MIPGADLDSIHAWAVALIAATAGAIALARRKLWNTRDALQARLARHLDVYMASEQDEAARATLRNALRTEFRQRAVPHEEHRDRVTGAAELVKSRMTLPQIAVLNSTLGKIGYSA